MDSEHFFATREEYRFAYLLKRKVKPSRSHVKHGVTQQGLPGLLGEETTPHHHSGISMFPQSGPHGNVLARCTPSCLPATGNLTDL
jgi:hypothetical protein